MSKLPDWVKPPFNFGVEISGPVEGGRELGVDYTIPEPPPPLGRPPKAVTKNEELTQKMVARGDAYRGGRTHKYWIYEFGTSESTYYRALRLYRQAGHRDKKLKQGEGSVLSKKLRQLFDRK